MKICVACYEGPDVPEFSAYLGTLPETVFPVYALTKFLSCKLKEVVDLLDYFFVCLFVKEDFSDTNLPLLLSDHCINSRREMFVL